MNVLLILSALKKGWSYTKGFLALALKYWYIVVIVLMLIINSSLRNDIVDLNKEKDTLNQNMVALVQKNKTDLLEAQKKAQEKEIEILTKQKEVEQNYANQVKKLSIDVSNANSANARLSDKLSTNANKLSTITKDQADTYTKSLTELSRNCTERYTIMGAIAQEHRIAEERAVNLYNSLVDDNKE